MFALASASLNEGMRTTTEKKKRRKEGAKEENQNK